QIHPGGGPLRDDLLAGGCVRGRGNSPLGHERRRRHVVGGQGGHDRRVDRPDDVRGQRRILVGIPRAGGRKIIEGDRDGALSRRRVGHAERASDQDRPMELHLRIVLQESNYSDRSGLSESSRSFGSPARSFTGSSSPTVVYSSEEM